MKKQGRKIIFLALLIITIACMKNQNAYLFIKDFSSAVEKSDIKLTRKMINFPVLNGEYLLNTELNESTFEENFDLLFDETSKTLFSGLNKGDIIIRKDLKDLYNIKGASEYFQVNVAYVNEDTESVISYVFAIINKKYYLVAINMAG